METLPMRLLISCFLLVASISVSNADPLDSTARDMKASPSPFRIEGTIIKDVPLSLRLST
jgi:hypothetical protein